MAKIILSKTTSNLPEKKFISISNAAKFLQISPDTLRNWEKQGKLLPSRTSGGARRYNTGELLALRKEIHIVSSPSKGLLNVSQAALALNVSKDTIRNWDKGQLIETKRTKGGARRFTRAEINRLQGELGIPHSKPEAAPIVNVPNSEAKVHNFRFTLMPIAGLMLLILASILFIKSYIDAQEGKLAEPLKTIGILAKNLEAMQQGVLGIQTQLFATPAASPAPIKQPLSNPQVVLYSPISPTNGQISCAGCLTNSSSYISTVTTSDPNLSVSQVDKTVSLSFDLDHAHTWSQPQNFLSNVGIGTTSPTNGKVVISQVGGSTDPSLFINTEQSQDTQTVFAIQSDTANGSGPGSVKFKITADGSVYSDSIYTTPADLAEMYPAKADVEEASVVELISNPASASGYLVQRATTGSGNQLFGVVSTNPGLVLGKDFQNKDATDPQKPVALSGRVPVAVSDENGPIAIGDYLTASSIPGVAMKATKPGVVIGQALESFKSSAPVTSSTDQSSHLVNIQANLGRILVFVKVGFADPGNFFGSLTMDSEGNLIVPKITAGAIVLDPAIASSSSQLADSNVPAASSTFYDLSGKLASLEQRVKDLEQKKDATPAALPADSKPTPVATASAVLASAPEQLVATSSASQSMVADLNLTPPDILMATGSATLASLKVTDALSSDKLFTAMDAKIAGDFSVLGKTNLASTTIAGDVTVDGTFNISQNAINVIGLATDATTDSSSGILFLQNSPLAQGLDIFNGLVTIDKGGNLRAQSVTVADFRVVANKISGSGKIISGSKSVDINNTLVMKNSRILITPTSETSLVLAVTDKEEGKKFTVTAPQEVTSDLNFDWFMINETAN